MSEKLLTEAGLTLNEAKVYLSLLKLGKAPSGKIVTEARIAGGKVYETLYKLVDKGLVEIIVENNIKQFIAADPQSLLLYMEERKNELSQQAEKLAEIIPDLQKIKYLSETPENVYLIKGFRGIRPLVDATVLKAKGEFLIMGVRSSKEAQFNIFWQHWHQARVKQKKKARLLFTDKNTDYWDFFQKMGFTQTKTTFSLSPSSIMVIDHQTFIFSYDQKEFTCIHIVSESIAKSFASFFEGLWKIAKS